MAASSRRYCGCRPPCPRQCCTCRTINWVSNPAHAQMAAESLIHSLEDKGKLGTLTRALTVKHLQTRRRAGETPSFMKPRETWLTRMPAAMSLRKAAWVSKLDMQVDMPRQAYSLAAGRVCFRNSGSDCCNQKKCAFCRARRPSGPRFPSRMFVHGVVEPHPTPDDFPYTNSAGRSASTVLVPVQAAQLALLATASLYEIYAAVHACVTECGCAS